MTVCIDSNVVLGMFTAHHAHRPIVEAWLHKAFVWAVSTEILLEYEEIMLREGGAAKVAKMLQIMQMAAAVLGNLRFVSPTYRFRLITHDPDDDKFADCAVTAEADWLITGDGHFNSLIGSGYKPQPITPEEFINRFLNKSSPA